MPLPDWLRYNNNNNSDNNNNPLFAHDLLCLWGRINPKNRNMYVHDNNDDDDNEDDDDDDDDDDMLWIVSCLAMCGR